MTVEHQAATPELSASASGRASTARVVTQSKSPRTSPHTLTILLMVTVYNEIGARFGNVLPTNAILMAGLGHASVGFNKYLKFMLPLLGIWLVIMLVVFVRAAL